MGMCSDPPPPPDMTPYADALMENAAINKEIADAQLAWSKEQYAQNREILNRVLDTQLPIMEENARTAQEDRARWEEVFKPVEDRMVTEAMEYDTPERRAQAAGEAIADVTRAGEAQRESAARRLEGYGIDPSQTRAQAIDASLRIQEAAAQAGAGNLARRRVEETGRILRGEAINVGRGYAGDVARASQVATGAGSAAVGGATQVSDVGQRGYSAATAGYGRASADITGAAGVISNAYQNQLAAYEAGNAIPAAIAGTAAGAGTRLLFAADGGEIVGPGGPTDDAVNAAIPTSSGNQALNVSNGEYVIPADVVKWKGLEHIEKMISNSKQAMSERTAIMAPSGAGVVKPQAIPQGQ